MDRSGVERLIRDDGIETVKIGTPDMDGVYRGKRVSSKQFLAGCEGDGFAQCDVVFGWDIGEEVITGASLAVGGSVPAANALKTISCASHPEPTWIWDARVRLPVPTSTALSGSGR